MAKAVVFGTRTDGFVTETMRTILKGKRREDKNKKVGEAWESDLRFRRK